MTRLLLWLLRGYQLAISPFLGRSCRFYPSCSAYAAEAIQEHGSARGVVMAGKRLCKCNPWHSGGYDPVPPGRRSRSAAPPADSHDGPGSACRHDSRFSEFS